MKLLCKNRDRSVRASELFQNPASGGIRERGERNIEDGFAILNHVVQYITGFGYMQGAEPALAEIRPAGYSELTTGFLTPLNLHSRSGMEGELDWFKPSSRHFSV
jgi:hypothetical protein